MAETYTGTEGTAALAAGMKIADGTEDRRQGYLAINRSRDYIVQFFNAAKAYAESLVPAVWPVNRGGTGRTNIFSTTAPSSDAAPVVVKPDGSLARMSGQFSSSYVPQPPPVDLSSRVAKTGDTMTGNLGIDGAHLIVPAAAPATSSYAVAYINGDGRLSKGASSERYKKYISEIDPDSLGDIWPSLHRFQMRHGDAGDWKYGYIAERLHENPDQRPFVVYADVDGELVPDSIDFIALQGAQIAQLHQAIDLLAQRLEALEGA